MSGSVSLASKRIGDPLFGCHGLTFIHKQLQLVGVEHLTESRGQFLVPSIIVGRYGSALLFPESFCGTEYPGRSLKLSFGQSEMEAR